MQKADNEGSGSGQHWTGAFLDQMRQTTDPLGDETIADIVKKHEVEIINTIWQQLVKSDQIPPTGMPPEVAAYLDNSGRLPPWADSGLISKGEDFFMDRGFFCLVSLLCASLPECYVLANEAAVLGTTRDLEQHAYRRIFETTQLIVAVMSEGGLAKGEAGIKAAQKVRLMHAAIRHLLVTTPRKSDLPGPPKSFAEAIQKMPPWDPVKWGHPINQEDMAYTLLTFSYVIIRAFQIMRVKISPDEINAYLHCWNVVGYVMGVREELLARNMDEAACLFSKIKARQIGQSQAGEALADALVKCTRQIIARDSGGWLMGPVVKRLPTIIMHELLDRQTLAVLKIKRRTFGEWLLSKLLNVLVRIFENVYQSLGARFGSLIVDQLTAIPRGWKAELFQIPEKLKTSWKSKAAGTGKNH